MTRETRACEAPTGALVVRPALPDSVRLDAAATGATAAFALVALLLMFAGWEGFGRLNDLANAAVGWLTLVLALFLHRRIGRTLLGHSALVAAGLGAAGMSSGSWLVVTGATGYYLAGLVSALGVAALGAWLLHASRAAGQARLLAQRVARLGQAGGLVMVAGLLALPGVLAGQDDLETAPWHALASGVAWLGVYVLLPWWCAGVARAQVPDPSPVTARA